MSKARADKIRLFKSVSSVSDARSVLKEPGDAALIVRGRPRNFALLCPCGCRDLLIINLDPHAGAAWRSYNRKKGFSLYPSIWRESGCKSHFVISQNNVWWCDIEDDYDTSHSDSHLHELILPHLRSDSFVSFDEIAEKLDEVPWLVLVACRDLVRRGLAREGEGKTRGAFARQNN